MALLCSYNPKTNLIADQLHCIGRGIDFPSSKYDNFVVLVELRFLANLWNNFVHHTL